MNPSQDQVPSTSIETANEKRLHPFSWLFILITQLRTMFLPLVALIIFGRGGWMDFLGIGAALSLAAYSLIYSYGFRYRVNSNEIVVREGILDRTERHIPFERIQNITQARNILHRIFGVTELRLESAGGSKPEAVMNVITLEAAENLERIVKHQESNNISFNQEGEPNAYDVNAKTLIEVPNMDLLRLGLSSNRGIVLLGAVWAASWQTSYADSDNNNGKMIAQGFQWIKSLIGFEVQAGDWLMLGLRSFIFLLLALILLRLLSVVLTFLQFHRFKLERIGNSLRAESGLLTRIRANATINRVQRLVVKESWLMRWMQRRTLGLNVLGSRSNGNNEENEKHRLKWLAPIAPAKQIEAVVTGLFSEYQVSPNQWCGLHPLGWRREAIGGFLLFFVPGIVGAYFTPWALIFIALAIWQVYSAHRWCESARYALTDRVLAYRSGWLNIKWVLVPRDKIQAVRLTMSPFDRRAEMAKLELDISGGEQMEMAVSIPYLPIVEARGLMLLLQMQRLDDAAK